MPVILAAYLLFSPIKQQQKDQYIDIQIAYSQRLIQSIMDADQNIEEAIHEFHSKKEEIKTTISTQHLQANSRISSALEHCTNNTTLCMDWPIEIRNNLSQIMAIDSKQTYLTNNYSYISHVISSQHIEKYEKLHKLLDFLELYLDFKLYFTVTTDPFEGYKIEKKFIKEMFKCIKFDVINCKRMEKHYTARNNEIIQFLALTSAIAFDLTHLKTTIISCIKNYQQQTKVPEQLTQQIQNFLKETLYITNEHEQIVPPLNFANLPNATHFSDEEIISTYTERSIAQQLNSNIKALLKNLYTENIIDLLSVNKDSTLFFEKLIRLSHEYLTLSQYEKTEENITKHKKTLTLYITMQIINMHCTLHMNNQQKGKYYIYYTGKNIYIYITTNPTSVLEKLITFLMFIEYIYEYSKGRNKDKLIYKMIDLFSE